MKSWLQSAILGAGIVLASAGAALAVPVYATADGNIYAEKDPNSQVLGVMPAGTIGEGSSCLSGWCYVDMPSGPDGWVSAATLDNPPGHDPALERQQAPGGEFGGFTFDFNVAPVPQPDDDVALPEDEPGVCFYDRSGYGGRSFCAGPGDYADQLGSWEDRISSIEVFGGAEVEVCSGEGLSGSCTVLRRDTSRLPSRLNDRISSFEIY